MAAVEPGVHRGAQPRVVRLGGVGALVGHDACREEVLAAGLIAAQVLTGPGYGHVEVRPPSLTYTSSLTLHLSTRVAELHHSGLGPHSRRHRRVAPGQTGPLHRGNITGYHAALDFLRSFDAAVSCSVTVRYCAARNQPRPGRPGSLTTCLSSLASSGHAVRKPPWKSFREAGESRLRLKLPRVWRDMMKLRSAPIACHA